MDIITIAVVVLPIFALFKWMSDDLQKQHRNLRRIDFEIAVETTRQKLLDHNDGMPEFNNFVIEAKGKFEKFETKTAFIQSLEDKLNDHESKLIERNIGQESYRPYIIVRKLFKDQLQHLGDLAGVEAFLDTSNGFDDYFDLNFRILCIIQHLDQIDQFIVDNGEWDETLYLLGAR